ncbi:caffeine-induced death protein-like protein [Stipitochalara longipes BDJ]|nr:caffeine-induced death protein-like protein [Stipitochalara longipes BDJ]
MFPSQGPPGQGGGDLESRLRGLILNNANAAPSHVASKSGSSALPTHIQSMTPSEQQGNPTGAPNQGGDIEQSSFAGRKRPNQAQRRQMNAQLSIPIDTRPVPGAQAGRGSFGQQGHSPWGPPSNHGQFHNHQNQRYQQHQNQQYSPRFQNVGPGSPYSPRTPFPQTSPQSPMNQYQSGPSPQFQPRHHNQFQQYQQPGAFARPPAQNRQLYQPGLNQGQGRGRIFHQNGDEIANQSAYLENLVQERVPIVGIDSVEEAEKEAFRAVVEKACQEAIAQYEKEELGNDKFDTSTVELQCFGSLKSGFATKASDMDLALLTPKSIPAPDCPESPVPRLLERKLLDLGYGARLLTRTRVPIIKLCQQPTEKLLSDLLEERTKWESGFVAELEDDDEEVHEAETPNERKEKPEMQNTRNEANPENFATKNVHSRPRGESSGEKQISLKQKGQQSLGDYCNTAKRLLRKLGGRDLTSTSPDLNEEEGRILNSVCKAFISGLSSDLLSTRLRNYKSIAPLFDPALPPVQRTLQGIWNQIEGERLAMAWETRPLTESDDKQEYEALTIVEAWRTLQDKYGPLTESSIYNRQLYTASEKLKKISSLQLVFLEQIQHEDPVFYHSRAVKIGNDLRTRDQSNSSDYITPIVIAHYIAGIGNEQIREALQNAPHEGATLSQVALHHRALQLAIDYEHALKSSYFEDRDRAVVEEYITLLRSRDFYKQNGSSESEISLIAKIYTLPDPTHISPNKPRDRYKDHLEFPKADIGIQCDINFSAHLALHNTQLLRCYSHTDPRVKAMILFIKHWAKSRGINTPYRGTLSSYGYVLMVLHYLVNIAQPFVCPNLQLVNHNPPEYLPPAEIEARTICKGRDVRFWRNEAEIKNLSDRNLLNHNHDSVGTLLRGFFEYFAQNGQMSTGYNRGFDWGREVLSLRTVGGIMTKQEKGWTGAKTVVETSTIAAPPTPLSATLPDGSSNSAASPGAQAQEVLKTPKLPPKTMEETKEIRHRYLFAIEDPFELDHNVARTVTHNGIVSIRDEFRRAWRIIRSIGKPYEGQEGRLLDPVTSEDDNKNSLQGLLNMIHGPAPAIKEAGQEAHT